MVRTPHKGETAQNDAMQILLSIIIHKKLFKSNKWKVLFAKKETNFINKLSHIK